MTNINFVVASTTTNRNKQMNKLLLCFLVQVGKARLFPLYYVLILIRGAQDNDIIN